MRAETLLIAMLFVAAGTDIASRRIPNALVVSGMVGALMFRLFVPGSGGWQDWLLGGLTGFGTFLPFYIAKGMGAGDVKLMAAVGSFVGPVLAFKIALATFLIGGVWAIFLVILKGQWRSTWKNLCLIAMPFLAHVGVAAATPLQRMRSVGRLPYGVAIALGSFSILLLETA